MGWVAGYPMFAARLGLRDGEVLPRILLPRQRRVTARRQGHERTIRTPTSRGPNPPSRLMMVSLLVSLGDRTQSNSVQRGRAVLHVLPLEKTRETSRSQKNSCLASTLWNRLRTCRSPVRVGRTCSTRTSPFPSNRLPKLEVAGSTSVTRCPTLLSHRRGSTAGPPVTKESSNPLQRGSVGRLVEK